MNGPKFFLLLLNTLNILVQAAKSSSFSDLRFGSGECGETKGCLFQPPRCIPFQDCAYAFSYTYDGTRLYFELVAKLRLRIETGSGAYVAVGFSKDDLMGHDTVTECSSFQGRPFQGRLSYNPGKSNRRVPIDEITHDITLQTIQSSYNDGWLYCVLSQATQGLPGLHERYVSPLVDQPYFVFLASGATDGEELVVHDLDDKFSTYPFYSDGPIDLTEFHDEKISERYNQTVLDSVNITDTAGDLVVNHTRRKLRVNGMAEPRASEMFIERNGRRHSLEGIERRTKARLTTAHGVSMCVAWLVFVPLAVIIARYGRRIWHKDRRLCNAPMWVNVHRVLNISAVVLMIFSCLCIFAAHGWHWHGLEAFTSGQAMELHGLLGLVACALAFSQLLNSLCRCRLGTTIRVVHNVIHRCCGVTSLVIGLVTLALPFWNIFNGYSLPRIIFIIYLVVVIGSVALLEPLKLRLWCQKRQQENQRLHQNISAAANKSGSSRQPQQRKGNLKRPLAPTVSAAQRAQDVMVRRFQTVTVAVVAVFATTVTLLLSALVAVRDKLQ